MTNICIAVDLDETLVLTDTLHESIALLAREKPFSLLCLPFWLLNGKASFKSKISERVSLDPQTLRYNRPLIEWLKQKQLSGHKIALCTAANQSIAQSIARHLGCFDRVFSSDGRSNLDGERKVALLEEEFGASGFDYVGNSKVDIDVWRRSRKAIVVNAAKSLVKRVEKIAEVETVFPRTRIPISAWRDMYRIHQWIKNALLFIPFVLAHQFGNVGMMITLSLAFAAFSFCASSVYIVNDLLDLGSDRAHPRKRDRPFASCTVPLKYGVIVAPISLMVSFGLAYIVGTAFFLWLLVYLLLASAYSAWLKKIVILDAISLTGLYTIRIIAGGSAVAVTLSFWLLAFSIFVFLSLAFVKRFAELQDLIEHGNARASGRGYVTSDASLVRTLGITSGYTSVLVLALYFQGETVMTLYSVPELIWGVVPLMLFWISWVWMKAHRGEMHDDPIVFAVRDPASLSVTIMIAICTILAMVLDGT